MTQRHVSLRPYNTFGIEAFAKSFAVFQSIEQLIQLLQEKGLSDPLLVLGGGSNILFTKDFDGLVLKNELMGIEVQKEDAAHVWIKVGAGENWHQFVMFCVAHGFAGVENLSLIPGCTGASPMQNIGAYGVEIKDVFESLEALHINDQSLVQFDNAACEFGYRESVFKRKYKDEFVITSVIFKLNKQPVFHTSYGAIEQQLEAMGVKELSIKAISDAVIHIRQSKLPDPAVVGNAGSFFKNPSIAADQYVALKKQFVSMPGFEQVHDAEVTFKVPAGWLIEQCGWKGYRKDDYGVHPKQALVLVNYGNANGKQLYDLSSDIKRSVFDSFGIDLEREVNII